MSHHILQLLLSDDPRRRGALTVWAVATTNYLLFSGVQMLEVHFGFMDAMASNLLIAAMLGPSAVFYALIRSNVAMRLKLDPALSLTQLAFGTALSLWSYAVTGPARGAILALIVAGFVYVVFSVTPQRARALAVVTLAGLGIVMTWRAGVDPVGYPPLVELVHFLFTAIAVAGTTRLSGHLSQLRAKLGSQSRDLKAANEKLRLLATRDELTQIHNRRYMTELIGIEQRQHERSGAPLCIALLDIDLFKSINDRFGHNAGDQVLHRFAQMARDELRTTDLLCRWGGEEFLVLFPDTPAQQAFNGLQRLHERVRSELFDALGPQHRVTFSAGLTPVLPNESLETATERADQAMYHAKACGRDQTALAPVRASEAANQRAEPPQSKAALAKAV
jgi:diguanylate cyclase (GGDEF)-like protein